MKFVRDLTARFALLLLTFPLVPYFAHARFRQPNAEYQARRAKLRAAVDGPIVIFGYTGHEDASEVAVFFQEPNFYYLTGHDEPGAALVLIPDPPNGKPLDGPREIFYLPLRDPAEERWEGPKMVTGDPGVTEKSGFQVVEPLANLQPQADLRGIAPAIDAMRQVKSPGELALLQRAIDLSVDAQLDAMKQLHPGLYEYQVAARMKEIHEMGGCEREAYAPIVGAGFNSTVLHYSGLSREIKDDDVVVIDVGGKYGGYAADITRTLPANGKFTPRQREVYEIVLGAQNAALAAVKPGAVLYGGDSSLQQIVTDYINTHGQDKEGRTLGRYYTHGISHHLGLDVHDPGDRGRPLEPGMVITVEPGIYIAEENLGVRIEDDVLVTQDGYQLLTARLPRTVEQLEKMMAESRAQPPQ
jgi:Xaa-Pro aminopeptidase